MRSARIMIKFGREFVAKSELGSERQTMFNPQSVIFTEIQLIKSPELISRVVDISGSGKVVPWLSGFLQPKTDYVRLVKDFARNLR